MASVQPFKAIRPTRDKANLVASRSYLSYSDETLTEKLDHNPYTFLHIINPDYSDVVKKSGNKRFEMTKAKFQEFQQKGILLQEDKPCFYLYQQNNNRNIFEGIIAATAIKDYQNGIIKKHELTLTKREEMFKNYLKITGFNADPVLLSHAPNKIISEVIAKYKSQRAEYEFATTNKSVHKLWVVNDKTDCNTLINAFASIDNLYIADGHHRSASSALLAQTSTKANSQYFMSCLIDENQLNIINFNRLIKHTNELTKNELITEIEKSFTVKNKGKQNYSPTLKDEISMYLSENWYSLIVKPELLNTDCVSKLDPAILADNILAPILNITDERTDKNIVFEAGATPLSEIKQKVDNGKFAVAFILKPIPISALKEVADNNRFMPPKSTYIEPKLCSGLTIYSLD